MCGLSLVPFEAKKQMFSMAWYLRYKINILKLIFKKIISAIWHVKA